MGAMITPAPNHAPVEPVVLVALVAFVALVWWGYRRWRR
jgi:hypothetical protein